jgi:Xaa-Pro aminopeptidase
MTPEQRRRYDAILEAAREARKRIKPGAIFDDSWMYDENGLPK